MNINPSQDISNSVIGNFVQGRSLHHRVKSAAAREKMRQDLAAKPPRKKARKASKIARRTGRNR